MPERRRSVVNAKEQPERSDGLARAENDLVTQAFQKKSRSLESIRPGGYCELF